MSDAPLFQIHTMATPDKQCQLRCATLEPNREFSTYIVFANGRTEWIEKYDYLPDALGITDRAGFLTWDHRGQGDSGGTRSYIDSYQTYCQDMQHIIAQVCQDKAYVVVAHSMGSLVTLRSALKGMIQPRAMVLCSPLLGLPDDPIPRPIARPLAAWLDRIGFGKISSGAGSHTRVPFERNKLTHDVDLFHRMRNGPYKVPGATFGWVKATYAAIDEVFGSDNLANLSVPTLVLAGSDERVVDSQAFSRWTRRAEADGSAQVRLQIIQGARHELLSEIEKYFNAATKAIRDWIDPHL